MKDSNGKTPLHLAAEMGQIEVVRFLSSHPTIEDVDKKDSNGKTPLHLAAEMGQIEVVSILSCHSSKDINAQDSQGLAPFGSAVKRRHKAAAQHLQPFTLSKNIYWYVTGFSESFVDNAQAFLKIMSMLMGLMF